MLRNLIIGDKGKKIEERSIFSVIGQNNILGNAGFAVGSENVG